MMLADRLNAGFAAAYAAAPAITVRAPGRVNLIGEHTDYNDGFAMPIAIGQETQVAFTPQVGAPLQVAALDFADSDAFDPAAPDRATAGDWRNYVRGVVDELVRAGVSVPGGQMAIAGSIARGTGLSSSASLEVAVARSLLQAAGLDWRAIDIALLGQRAECDFVGVRCGNLDQIASACTQAGHALLIDCRSLDLRQIAMPDDARVMIVQSGVVRGLLDGEYNTRRRECEAAAAIMGVAALRDADAAMLAAARGRMDDVTHARARHVISDNRLTLEAAEALAAGDLVTAGVLMRESHRTQAQDFGITVPATDRLADILNAAIGPQGGARQTGGGFGGAVVGLMRADQVDTVREAVLASYRTPAGEAPMISIEAPCHGAQVLA
ncbi:galactokinase [Novosphingobium sp. FSY-8]|uniref:Galactokinase n=1 Tax=Novosphingobium ovatum TaxID=1908523 RepID=A0ABW9XCC5_9SPHN|nr:galactokinase [Novosphingobium ovatum]NBC36150.1 galactokinase [Novosphingobium ovatum]